MGSQSKNTPTKIEPTFRLTKVQNTPSKSRIILGKDASSWCQLTG